MRRGDPLLPYRPATLAKALAPLAVLEEEVLLVIYMDARGDHVGDEILAGGTSNQFSTRYRFLFERAFDHGARALVLAHNHPSGAALPSRHDIISTRSLQALTIPMEIKLIDHLIVGARAVFSMRAAGFLD